MQMAAGKFKAQCLQLMDLVNETHQEVVVTKRGRAVAALVAVETDAPRPIFGRLRGRLDVSADIVGPLPYAWDADAGTKA